MANHQQVAVKQKADTVRAALDKLKPQMAMALPKHLTPDRLLRVTMTAVQNTPKLLDCDRTSLFAAVLTCAQLGLEPDGVLGQAYLVPFRGRVQFIPGYKGYLTLARNSGEISSIQAHEVCANDEFDYAYGLEERLQHRPAEGDRGEITHVYAYAKYKDGGHIFEVMTRTQIDAVRDNSEGYKAFKSGVIKSNPWDSHYPQMARKTAIRRLANYLPMSVQRAAAIDAAYDDGKHGRTDEYGDVVIEGDSEVIDDDQDTGANNATSKLDAMAGGDDEVQEQEPRARGRPRSRKTKVEAPEAEGDRVPFNAPAGAHWEGGELIDDETGEIVTGHYDAKGKLKAKGNGQQQDSAGGLFGDEG